MSIERKMSSRVPVFLAGAALALGCVALYCLVLGRDRPHVRSASDSALAAPPELPVHGESGERRALADQVRIVMQERQRPGALDAPSVATYFARMPPFDDSGPTPALDHYVLSVMHTEILPMISSCVSAHSDDDTAHVTLHFTIEGDTRSGGVVDNVRIELRNDAASPASVTQCLEQSLLSMIFDAPPENAANIAVEFPVVFLSDGSAQLDFGGDDQNQSGIDDDSQN